jgi:hypothetical protein
MTASSAGAQFSLDLIESTMQQTIQDNDRMSAFARLVSGEQAPDRVPLEKSAQNILAPHKRKTLFNIWITRHGPLFQKLAEEEERSISFLVRKALEQYLSSKS